MRRRRNPQSARDRLERDIDRLDGQANELEGELGDIDEDEEIISAYLKDAPDELTTRAGKEAWKRVRIAMPEIKKRLQVERLLIKDKIKAIEKHITKLEAEYDRLSED